MNPLQTRLLAGLLQSCVVAVPLLVGHPASAAEPAARPCMPAFESSRSARLAAKDAEGPSALRRYVTMTDPIYRIDMDTARQQAARHRQAASVCEAEGIAP